MVADQDRLATRFRDIVDLIRQSSDSARKNGNGFVEGGDVRRAIEEREYRANRLEVRIQEMIEDGTILIDTEGEVDGQVNGSSILPLGDYAFGKPSRITAQTHVGNTGVVIPEANVCNLALRQPGIDAVSEGRFHIYPVAAIEGEEKTDHPAGALKAALSDVLY